MIYSASAAIRVAPELFPITRELKPTQKYDEDSRSPTVEGDASHRASKPTHADNVGQLVNVEA